jgi:hypothetical protein
MKSNLCFIGTRETTSSYFVLTSVPPQFHETYGTALAVAADVLTLLATGNVVTEDVLRVELGKRFLGS